MGIAQRIPTARLVTDAILLGELSENMALFLAVDEEDISLSALVDEGKPATLQVLFNKPVDYDLWQNADLPRAAIVLCNARDTQQYFRLNNPMAALVDAQSLPGGDVIGELPLTYGVGPDPVQYVPGGRQKILTALLD